jgi:hypothetical protein
LNKEKNKTILCGKKEINRLLIFDNNKKMNLIFDSKNITTTNKFEFENNLTRITGGKTYKRHNRKRRKSKNKKQ